MKSWARDEWQEEDASKEQVSGQCDAGKLGARALEFFELLESGAAIFLGSSLFFQWSREQSRGCGAALAASFRRFPAANLHQRLASAAKR